MLLANIEPLMPNEILFHLKKEFPTGWSARETVVVRLAFNEDDNRMEFNMSAAEIYRTVNTEAQLRAFLGRLATGTQPAPTEIRLPEGGSPLGIPVRNVSNVVVVLDDRDWHFRAGAPAITAKADKPGDNYGSWHVDRNGVILEAPAANCRIAVFLVARRARDEIQRFNFHLALEQEGGGLLEIAVDPDVPETGTEGFP